MMEAMGYELQELQALVFVNRDLVTEGMDYEMETQRVRPTVTIKFEQPLQKGDVVRVIRPDFKCHKFVMNDDGLSEVELAHMQWVL
jgi:hypothetical protein